MCGRATLATEESSTTMNVASMTETATIHGLTLGTQLPCASSRELAAIARPGSGSYSGGAQNPGHTHRSAGAGGCRIQGELQSETIVARKGRGVGGRGWLRRYGLSVASTASRGCGGCAAESQLTIVPRGEKDALARRRRRYDCHIPVLAGVEGEAAIQQDVTARFTVCPFSPTDDLHADRKSTRLNS